MQGLLWSKDIDDINLKEDKVYVIHQILSYGNLNQIKWLFKIYPARDIKEIFLRSPQKIYLPSVFNFVKKFILNINKNLSETDYVKTSF